MILTAHGGAVLCGLALGRSWEICLLSQLQPTNAGCGGLLVTSCGACGDVSVLLPQGSQGVFLHRDVVRVKHLSGSDVFRVWGK